jgi:hypothetical protein
MSSLSFLGNATSYLSIPSSSGTNMETGDFTIEWYQYQTDNNSYPRIFAIGNYPSTSIGVSIEGGTLYFWSNGTYRGTISLGTFRNTWIHFAIVRSSNTTKVYRNGAASITWADTYNYTSASNLVISNESSVSAGAAFGGYMAYFHVMKGFAKYTTTFQVPNTFPTATANTTLLLMASGFTGTSGNTVTNNNVGTFALLPFTLVAPSAPSTNVVCFKEGSQILTKDGYRPVEELRKGDLIQTVEHGFLAIDMIGKREIVHEALENRIKNQLYRCNHEDVFDELVITGCHSILVEDFFSEEQREKTMEYNKGRVFITDNHYRLPAFLDDRTSVYEPAGTYTIYHFALANEDYYMNYGVYANGLLVETCSKRYLKEIANMSLIE